MSNEALLDMRLAELGAAHEKLSSTEFDYLIPAIRMQRVMRMSSTYSDLQKQPRYQLAVKFLVEDLLGSNDLSNRDMQLQKAKTAMTKILPGALLGTVAKAIELTVLSIELDIGIAKQLHKLEVVAGQLSDAELSNGIKYSDNYSEHIRQVDMVCMVGAEIENVVHKPFVATALKMCRKPAQLMGLAHLQDYLERGFHAFKKMRGSADFLDVFEQREKHYLGNIFS